MELSTIIGFLAAMFTTIAFLPQAVRAWKTKSTKDISLATFIMFCIGVLFWLTYGLMISDIPIITANTITILIALSVLAMKLKYG